MHGSALKAARRNAGLTQKQLADRVGVGSGYISLLENDVRRAGPELARKLNDMFENGDIAPEFTAIPKKYSAKSASAGKEIDKAILSEVLSVVLASEIDDTSDGKDEFIQTMVETTVSLYGYISSTKDHTVLSILRRHAAGHAVA